MTMIRVGCSTYTLESWKNNATSLKCDDRSNRQVADLQKTVNHVRLARVKYTKRETRETYQGMLSDQDL